MSKQEDSSAKKHAKNTGIGAAVGAVGGAVSVFSLKSLTGVILTKIGFTAGGVGATTVAAGVQAGIGNVLVGSWFAFCQSTAATGLAAFTPVYVPVIIGGGIVGAGIALNRSLKKSAE